MTDPISSAMYQELNKEIARQHDTIKRLEDDNKALRGGFILPENWFLSRLVHQAADLYLCIVVEAKDLGGRCVEESGTTPLDAMQNAAIKAWEATK